MNKGKKTVSGLRESTTYEFRIRAKNEDGRGPWKTLKFKTLPDALSLPRAKRSIFKNAFEGGFKPGEHNLKLLGEDYHNNHASGTIMVDSTTGTAWIGGWTHGFNTGAVDGIIRVRLPTPSSSSDPDQWPKAVALDSSYTPLWGNGVGTGKIQNNQGGTYYNGKLFVQYSVDFTSDYSDSTLGYFQEAHKLKPADFHGYYAVQTTPTENKRSFFTSDWLTQIPDMFREYFGKANTHIFGGGHTNSAG